MITPGTGAALRNERLRQGLSLEEISLRTRISPRFLEAIEADDFSRLPGLLFTRNFVRQFAAALGVNPAPLLAALPKVDIDSVPLPDPAQFARPRMRNPRWVSALSSLAWLLLATGASVGGYAYLNHRQNPSGVSSRETVLPQQSTPAQTVTQTAFNPGNEPAVASVPALVSVASVVSAQPQEDGVQVVLKAKEASWVQIFADGKNAFTGMLQPNDSRSIVAHDAVRLTAGNAGGLEISLNGKSLDPLGPSGQVRSVRLTAEGPQLIVKASQTSAPL